MIYIFIAPGFEEIEALAPLDILRRAELPTQLVGVGGRTIVGAHGIAVSCDITDEEAVLQDLEMMVLPGGMPGTLNLEKSVVVQQFVDHAVQSGLWLAAICAAPSILGHKGLLDGRKATCFPGYETQLGAAIHTNERVVRDGKLVTGKGAGAAVLFGLELVACLKGEAYAGKLEESLQ